MAENKKWYWVFFVFIVTSIGAAIIGIAVSDVDKAIRGDDSKVIIQKLNELRETAKTKREAGQDFEKEKEKILDIGINIDEKFKS